MRLQEKVVFITGAAGGIGKAAALICAGYGAKVAVVDLNEEAVAQTAKEICDAGGEAIACKVDVTKRDMVKAAVDMTIKKYGKIDCLFNNAGVVKSCYLVECSDEVLAEDVDEREVGLELVDLRLELLDLLRLLFVNFLDVGGVLFVCLLVAVEGALHEVGERPDNQRTQKRKDGADDRDNLDDAYFHIRRPPY